MKIFNIGGIRIQLLQKQNTLELFEIFSEKEGVGPGLHFHRNMEESFYVLSGKVLFTVEERKIIAREGESFSIPRKSIHSWKTAEKNTKMLILFSPAQNQADYFAQLEKLHNRGDSWEEAIAVLATAFDNTPV